MSQHIIVDDTYLINRRRQVVNLCRLGLPNLSKSAPSLTFSVLSSIKREQKSHIVSSQILCSFAFVLSGRTSFHLNHMKFEFKTQIVPVNQICFCEVSQPNHYLVLRGMTRSSFVLLDRSKYKIWPKIRLILLNLGPIIV